MTSRDGDKLTTETDLPDGNKSVRVYEFTDAGVTVVSFYVPHNGSNKRRSKTKNFQLRQLFAQMEIIWVSVSLNFGTAIVSPRVNVLSRGYENFFAISISGERCVFFYFQHLSDKKTGVKAVRHYTRV